MEHAGRLAPRAYVAGLSAFHFLCGDFAQALEHAERVIVTNPTYTFGFAMAISSAWWLGDERRARAHARALRRQQPAFSPVRFLATFGPGVAAVERIAHALSRVGF
jgi:hypothetical protein